MVIQEGLLCRECDTPLDSDKHFLGRTSRSKCPYATSCYRAMLRHSGYCAGSLSLEAAPRPAPTLYCICEYSTDISTDILSHLLVTQHTNAYLTEELARANTVREEPKPADEVEPTKLLSIPWIHRAGAGSIALQGEELQQCLGLATQV
ncbi:unnamed protein product [Danaus chrysippus]|uniref:(African queen) hypothetical protein n=1 Tax=Danaus chrysippus TaxID=151541 RepID=A0A8J2QTS2_9NEOP|nr:unnamed protein product [Danaus chrysippus]